MPASQRDKTLASINGGEQHPSSFDEHVVLGDVLVTNRATGSKLNCQRIGELLGVCTAFANASRIAMHIVR